MDHTAHVTPVADGVQLEASCCHADDAVGAGQTPPLDSAPPAAAVSTSRALDFDLAPYRPVLIITAVSLIGGALAGITGPAGAGFELGMRMAMGLFLLPLALLKLFDVQGFAAGFRRYDPIAKLIPAYALAYPFIEAALALAFIAGVWLVAAYAATALLFGIGAIGIAQSLARKEDLACACVGTQLGVPLGRVSLAENVAMTIMAAAMLAA